MEKITALIAAIAEWIQNLIDTCKEFAAGFGKTYKFEEEAAPEVAE